MRKTVALALVFFSLGGLAGAALPRDVVNENRYAKLLELQPNSLKRGDYTFVWKGLTISYMGVEDYTGSLVAQAGGNFDVVGINGSGQLEAGTITTAQELTDYQTGMLQAHRQWIQARNDFLKDVVNAATRADARAVPFPPKWRK